MTPTIKDVANLAGTSIATVSRVINGVDCVSEDTKKRVEKAINDLGYRPNPVGRMLKSGGINSISVILPYRLSSFYGRLVNGMTQEAIAHDYTLLVCACNDDRDYEKTIVDRLLKDVVKGFVFLGSFMDSHELSEIDKKLPTVLCCEQVRKSDLLTVVADYEAGAKMAVEKLISAGHKRIGYISMRHKPYSSELKQKGFQDALREAGIEDRDEYYFYGAHTVQTGGSAMKYFACLDEPPTAIFAENDRLAAGAVACAEGMGMKVGKDIAIIGFDDLDICTMTNPKLSSVHQPLEEMGKIVVRMLIEIINQERENSGTIKVPVSLSLRETVN